MYLVVRDHDQTLRKRTLDPAVGCQTKLIGHRRIPTDSYCRRSPPLRHSRHEQAKRLLRQGHVGIVEIAVDQV